MLHICKVSKTKKKRLSKTDHENYRISTSGNGLCQFFVRPNRVNNVKMNFLEMKFPYLKHRHRPQTS